MASEQKWSVAGVLPIAPAGSRPPPPESMVEFGLQENEMDELFDDCFGLCPICHKSDGYVNPGSSQYFYCGAHKKAWCAGSNLLSNWRAQTKDEQRRFEQVEPYFYPRPEVEQTTVTKATSATRSFDEAMAYDARMRGAVLRALAEAFD
jgi:hypothetical protein